MQFFLSEILISATGNTKQGKKNPNKQANKQPPPQHV